MSLEYILYLPLALKTEEFLDALSSQHLPHDFYSSSKHHPNAMLLHRTHYSKKIQSTQYANSQKTVILYFPTLASLYPLPALSSYLASCTQNQIVPILLIQGVEESLEISNFTQSLDFDSEDLHETLAKWMIEGTDCIFTDSTKESVNFIQRILEILTNAPYRNDPSIHRIHGRKLKANTEILEKNKNWALQLINIPGISEKKALKIIERFPKMSDLIEFYLNEKVTTAEKKNLLNNISERKEKRLSEKIFTVYSSLNEDEPV